MKTNRVQRGIAMVILDLCVSVIDTVLYPIYYFWYRPWHVVKRREAPRGKLYFTSDNKVLYRGLDDSSYLRDLLLERKSEFGTLNDLFQHVYRKYADQKCLGRRRILSVTEGTFNGKPTKKLKQENVYTWDSFRQVEEKVGRVSAAMRQLCEIKHQDKIVILANTKPQWMITTLSSFKNGSVVVTLYTTMTDDAVLFGIEQSEAQVLVTDQEQVSRASTMLAGSPNSKVKTIVYFEDEHSNRVVPQRQFKLIAFEQLESFPCNVATQPTFADPEDVALIMYTSGTTGVPKGVVFKHRTLLLGMKAASMLAVHVMKRNFTPPQPHEAFIGYLPLAHVYEFTQEVLSLMMGIPVAYASPGTLTDISPQVPEGERGDMTVAKPTTCIAVPLVLDRMYRAIQKKVSAKGPKFEAFFAFCYNYKKRWADKGFDTPLLNRILFKKIALAFGGNLRWLMSGGAPLAPQVQEFIRLCLCLDCLQGYGLTESNGGAIISDGDDYSLGEIGTTGPDTLLMLENWDEGGYGVQDADGPQGEIILGGEMIADGYYRCESEEDKNAFFTDEKGTKWFRTGDIGRINLKTITVEIVDRKKQIVKLQNSEYISLSKIELTTASNPLVSMVCVVADSFKSRPVALVIPDFDQLNGVREQLLIAKQLTRRELCDNETVVDYYSQQLTEHLKENKLAKYEIPSRFTLIPEIWTPDTGLVTGAMKLRRKKIEQKFQSEIRLMFSDQ